jgi:hypothetical protein
VRLFGRFVTGSAGRWNRLFHGSDADGIVQLAPTARVMWKLLLICDVLADVFRIKFNANKSACIIFCLSRHRSLVSKELPSFMIGGQTTENANQWSHIGLGLTWT